MNRFDFILAMDKDNLANLERLRPPGSRAKVALLLSHAPPNRSARGPDPRYGGADGLEKVRDRVESAADGFVASALSN
jgi:protein-tyrosine phosphatase